MLNRLANSGSQTKWFRLWDKVWQRKNLRAAVTAVLGNNGAPGVDGQSVARFKEKLEQELPRLERELRAGSYRAQAARRVWIPKPGGTEKRPLGIPAVRDRVVQTALRNVLEPIFEHDFAARSYGFRPGRSAHEAVAQVEALLNSGHTHVVDADLKSYFDTIPHDQLLERLSARIADGKVLELIQKFLQAGVMEAMKDWRPTERGTPQGGVISPLLANLYLNPLDHALAERGWELVRYADDFVILCRSRPEAEAAQAFIAGWTRAAGLSLHPEKTRLVDARQERFEFLGWSIGVKAERSQKWPRSKSVQKLRARLRPLTKRTNGQSLGRIIEQVNPVLRGWRAYFGSEAWRLGNEDGWLRKRLRAMLRKRQKRPGRGGTPGDHRKWPNHWFGAQGLYSLKDGPGAYG